MRTISKLQAPPRWIVLHLQPYSSIASSASDGLSTSATTRVLFWSYGQSLKSSSKRTLEILRPLLTTSRVSLQETPSSSWKRPETGHHTSNSSNLPWQSLTLLRPLMSQLWFATFGKASNPLSKLKWSSRIGHQLASTRWCRGRSI